MHTLTFLLSLVFLHTNAYAESPVDPAFSNLRTAFTSGRNLSLPSGSTQKYCSAYDARIAPTQAISFSFSTNQFGAIDLVMSMLDQFGNAKESIRTRCINDTQALVCSGRYFNIYLRVDAQEKNWLFEEVLNNPNPDIAQIPAISDPEHLALSYGFCPIQ
jgi:hypothetical protein